MGTPDVRAGQKIFAVSAAGREDALGLLPHLQPDPDERRRSCKTAVLLAAVLAAGGWLGLDFDARRSTGTRCGSSATRRTDKSRSNG